jgi:hypothetical protein
MKKLPRFAGRFVYLFLLFSLFCIRGFSQQESVGSDPLSAVLSSFDRLERSGGYVENLASASLNTLPIGIKRTVNNTEITIAVDQVTFHREYAEMSVYARMILPQTVAGRQTTLFFGGRGIKLSYDGSIIGMPR